MGGKGEYGHRFAAVLASCALIATTALPVSPAHAFEPAVGSDNAFYGDMVSAEASTTVDILVSRTPFAIVDATEDFAGLASMVRAQTLRVVVQGEGALTCVWTRAVDGEADATFWATGLEHALADDDIVDEHRYRYTATIRESYSGELLSCSIDVLASAYHEWRTLADPESGVSVSGYIRSDTQLFVEELPSDDPRRASLEQSAGARVIDELFGLRLECPGDSDPFVVDLVVSVPRDDAAQAAALDAESSAEAVEVLRCSDELVVSSLAGALENGVVKFRVRELGAFAVLSDRVRTRTITATVSPGGRIEPAGVVEVPVSAEQAFVITPDAGYRVDSVLVDGEEIAYAGTSCTLAASELDQTVHVEFAAVEGGPGTGEPALPNLGHGAGPASDQRGFGSNATLPQLSDGQRRCAVLCALGLVALCLALCGRERVHPRHRSLGARIRKGR